MKRRREASVEETPQRRRRGYSRTKRPRLENLRDHEQLTTYLQDNYYTNKSLLLRDTPSQQQQVVVEATQHYQLKKDDLISMFYKDNKSQCRKPNKKLTLEEFKELSDEKVENLKGCKAPLLQQSEQWSEEYMHKLLQIHHLEVIGIPGVWNISDFPDQLASFNKLRTIQARISTKCTEPINLYWKHYSTLTDREKRKDFLITSITAKQHDIVNNLRSQVDDLQGFLVTKDFKHYVVWTNLRSKKAFVACGYLAYFKRGKCQILSQIMVLEEFRRQQLGTALYSHFKQENKKFSLFVESPEPGFCSLIYRHEKKNIDQIGCFVSGDFYVMSKWMASYYEEEYSPDGKALGRFRYQNDPNRSNNYRKVIHVWIVCSDGVICKTSPDEPQALSPFLVVPVLLEDLHPFDLALELAPYLPKRFKIEPVCVQKMYRNDIKKEFVDIYALYVDDDKISVTIPEGTAAVDVCIKKYKLESNI